MTLLFLSIASNIREKTFDYFHFIDVLLRANGVVGLLANADGMSIERFTILRTKYLGSTITNPLGLWNLSNSVIHLHLDL